MHYRSFHWVAGILLFLSLLSSCSSVRYAGVDRIREYTITDADIPEAFDGYRIAFATDFHLKSRFKERQLQGTVEALHHLSPDLLILGGDYQEGCDYVEPLFSALGSVPVRDGIYAVLGNNDYERCTDTICQSMARNGIQLLEHRVDTVFRDSAYILLCGVNPYTYREQPVAPTAALNDSDFVVLITHTPDYVEDADITGTDLALAGHTHGGQVTLFGLYAPVTASKYGNRFRSGLKYNSHGVPVIISNGLGTSRYNIRFCAPTDIVIVRLRSEKEGGNLSPNEVE